MSPYPDIEKGTEEEIDTLLVVPPRFLDLPPPLPRITVCLCEPGIAVPLRPSSLDSSGMMHFIKKVVRASQP